jgi:hypothetical protein
VCETDLHVHDVCILIESNVEETHLVNY